jgi:hypothetical protein
MPIPELSYLFETAPSVQIIRMRNATWVLPFLFKAFKQENTLSLPEPPSSASWQNSSVIIPKT